MDDLEISREADPRLSNPDSEDGGGVEATTEDSGSAEVEANEEPQSEDAAGPEEAAPEGAPAAEAEEPAPAVAPEPTAEDVEAARAAEDAAEEDPSPDAPELTEEELVRRTSALVFASPEPLSAGRLSKLLGGVGTAKVRAALEIVSKRLDQADLGLQLRQIAGGTTFLTTPDLGPIVTLLVRSRSSDRVSPAALETLSVVAYRQPVTKAEIEAIRGVQAGPILRTLVDRGLIRVTGRADVPGHPLQYGTTKEFLDRFGLGSLEDLPRDAELARG